MAEIIKITRKTFIIWAIAFSVMLAAFGGCNEAPTKKLFTIGVAANSQRDALMLEGFRAGMSGLGYIEGKNLKYIYKDIIIEDEKVMDAQVKELLSQDIDILFLSGKAGGVAGTLTKGTNMPVLFCGDANPVENGTVESLSHPGGNITGVKAIDGITKTLEWLTTITPSAKKIWLPYDPDDQFSGTDVSRAEKAARQLKVEIVTQKVHSVEETVAAIEGLSKDIDAVFFIPSQMLFPGSGKIIQAATNRGLPTGSSSVSDESVLIVLTTDLFDAGKKTARLAQQIFQGVKPADIPVETPEAILTINLKTAKKIGLTIPDDILVQAKNIIR